MTRDLVWKEGRLDLRDVNVLKGALSEMGSAHTACGFVVTLWARLWVDHMWGIARGWGTRGGGGRKKNSPYHRFFVPLPPRGCAGKKISHPYV